MEGDQDDYPDLLLEPQGPLSDTAMAEILGSSSPEMNRFFDEMGDPLTQQQEQRNEDQEAEEQEAAVEVNAQLINPNTERENDSRDGNHDRGGPGDPFRHNLSDVYRDVHYESTAGDLQFRGAENNVSDCNLYNGQQQVEHQTTSGNRGDEAASEVIENELDLILNSQIQLPAQSLYPQPELLGEEGNPLLANADQVRTGSPNENENHVADLSNREDDAMEICERVEANEEDHADYAPQVPDQVYEHGESPHPFLSDIRGTTSGDAEQGPPQQAGVQFRAASSVRPLVPLHESIEQEGRTQHENPVFAGSNSQHPPSSLPAQGEFYIPEPSVHQHQDAREQHEPSNHQTQEQRQGGVLNTVEHDPSNAENLQWIAPMLPSIEETPSYGGAQQETVDFLDALLPQSTGNLGQQAPHVAQSVPPHSGSTPEPTEHSGRHLRRHFEPRDQGICHDWTCFSSELAAMRLTDTSYGAIVKAIAVPRLPSLDDEMDSGFQTQEPGLISWSVEDINSPTLSKIVEDATQHGDKFFITSELLFNRLFRLSRNSFLEREERVHLELMTQFFSSCFEDTRTFERDAKELIIWLETKFAPGNLAALTQKLVNSIDENIVIMYLVQMATMKYKPDPVEMTLLGAFLTLMSEHSDIMGMNRRMARSKKKLDADTKKAKEKIKSLRKVVPKGTYGRTDVPDSRMMIARGSSMLATFAATRWLIVGCADSHYAYGCSVLEAAEEMQKSVQLNQRKNLVRLKNAIFNLGRQANAAQAANEVVPASVVTRRMELMEVYNEEQLRPVNGVERTILQSFTETMRVLGNVTVVDLLRRLGGMIPTAFAKVLTEKGNEIETLRGVGSMDGLVVDDVVKVKEVVEKERAKSKSMERLLERKEAHLEECQRVVNGITGFSSGFGDAGAGPSNAMY